MEVYDRWGMLVWKQQCQGEGCPDYGEDFWWDGTNKQGNPVAKGVYYWVVYATPLSESKPIVRNGSITVVGGE
jgi:flagellar hook assembly protein FlgD